MRLDAGIALDLTRRALANVRREYPNHPQYLLHADADAVPPRVAHPSFFGCFDWHSAVHTHWLLARLLNAFHGVEEYTLRTAATATLGVSFRAEHLGVEADYLRARPTFERPYGLAWALALGGEVAKARAWAPAQWEDALAPLTAAARVNIERWLGLLRYPVRSGTHNQTAFALALIYDACGALDDAPLAAAVRVKALTCFGEDRDAPLRIEPSGEDFLSPSLMEADLMSRFLPPDDYADWLERFLPDLPWRESAEWLECAEILDEHDGKTVHLHGLNLSRAWNLARIAASLPSDDGRRSALLAAADRHRRAGVTAALAATDYASEHWLPTFVTYLLTAD